MRPGVVDVGCQLDEPSLLTLNAERMRNKDPSSKSLPLVAITSSGRRPSSLSLAPISISRELRVTSLACGLVSFAILGAKRDRLAAVWVLAESQDRQPGYLQRVKIGILHLNKRGAREKSPRRPPTPPTIRIRSGRLPMLRWAWRLNGRRPPTWSIPGILGLCSLGSCLESNCLPCASMITSYWPTARLDSRTFQAFGVP